MHNKERTHSRDLGYSKYLRTKGDDGRYASDVDYIEYSFDMGKINFHAVIEEKHEFEKEMSEAQKKRTIAIASRLEAEAYEVRHNGNEENQPTRFVVTHLATGKHSVKTEAEFDEWRTLIRKI